VKVLFRRGTAAQWSGKVPALGEPAYATDSRTLAIGDGATAYQSLAKLKALAASGAVGTAVLNGTTPVVVASTAVTASSVILLTVQTVGGTPGFVAVAARSAGVSFSVVSNNAADTSTVGYLVIEP
jgi:hypothetical protein